MIWWLLAWTTINANGLPNKNDIIDNTQKDLATTIFDDSEKSSNTAYYTNYLDSINDKSKQEQLEVLSNDLWNCIAESMISYFNNEIVAYKFNTTEQEALKKDIAEYFSQNDIFQVKQDKIIINIDKNGINKLFHKFLPHFMPKLKWYAKFWIKLLWIDKCCNMVYRDISKYKWKEAETFYLEDAATLVMYVTNWIKKKYPNVDITIWEYLTTMLNAIPNGYIINQYPTYSQSYLNQSILNIKTADPRQK